MTAPDGFLESVLEARAYVAARSMWESARNKADVQRTPMVDAVIENDMALAAEEIARG